MKRGLNLILPVQFGCSLDDVSSIDFIITQGAKRKKFTYPSLTAQRRTNTNIVDLYWDDDETWAFASGKCLMDTKVNFSASSENPETPIVEFTMNETLFRKGEI